MLSLRALCCLPSVKKQRHDFHFFPSMYNKTITVDSVFVIYRIIRVLVRDISNSLRASANNAYFNIDYSGYHKNLIQ